MANFPGREVGIYLADGSGPSFTALPAGSKLTSASLKSSYGNATFTPDIGGVYSIHFSVNGSDRWGSVNVASLLTRGISASGPERYQVSGKVFIFMDAGVVVASTATTAGQATPRIDGGNQLAKIAAQDSGVVAALAAMVGKTAAQLTSTYWPALVSAWTSASTNPSTPAGEDGGAVDLVADGWEKA